VAVPFENLRVRNPLAEALEATVPFENLRVRFPKQNLQTFENSRKTDFNVIFSSNVHGCVEK
jgi:hypothetical protein